MTDADRLDGLSPAEQRALLSRLLEDSRSAPRIFPVSFAQRRLWFLHRLLPDEPVYNIPVAIRFRGPLDEALLARSLDEIVRRHDVLRTTFVQAAPDADPVQVVHPPTGVPVAFEDLSGLPADAREPEMIRRANVAARCVFDLSRGPLYRAQLLKLQDEEHVLVLTLHHIIAEPWSIAILCRECEVLYAAFARGDASPLPDLPVQYGDYARWSRRDLTPDRLERGLAYWRQQLAGDLPTVSLPVDAVRTAERSVRGAFLARPLSRQLSDAVSAFARRTGTTRYIVLLTAFCALLRRYTGLQDTPIGAAVADRGQDETALLMGLFLNTVVLRIGASGNPTGTELLSRVRTVVLEALTYQEVPFEHIVEATHPARDPGLMPLFQILFAADDEPWPTLRLGASTTGEILPPELVHNGTSKVDLTVLVREEADGLVAGAEFSTDLFRRETIGRFLEHFETVLRAFVATPEARIADLDVIPETEKRLISAWMISRSAYPRDRTVHGLFEEQARRWPGAVAVSGTDTLTYAELNQRANRLALRLLRLGVRTEDVVAICLDRSVGMVVALLAVLKAGGAYLPLDPSLPQERMDFMLADTGAAVVLADIQQAGRFGPGRRVVRTDLDEDVTADRAADPVSGATALHLAYVIYTSGSTGVPKGTRVTHRGVVRLVRNSRFIQVEPHDVVLQLASTSFDASTFEIWGPLLNGGRLALHPPGTPSLSALGAEIQRQGITVLRLAAGLFHQMVDENPEGLRGVRQMLAAGDVLSVPHVRRALGIYRGSRIVNGYGPTENTGLTTSWPMVDPSDVGATVPIGWPIANTSVYILDERLRPVPVGVPGELCTGGDGVARDYLRRPGLTAERFLPDPFIGEPGARMYRTGDRARYLADGRIEFLGRTDRQVKIRGFRVELGEVEVQLSRHPGIERSAVVTHEVTPGDVRLVAYFVPTVSAPTSRALRSFLEERIPSYMVPSLFVALDAMPLTPNGKIDRRALPAPHEREPTPGADLESPVGDVEQVIADIWRKVLRVDQVGRHQNFFDLGGHSLLMTQVLSRLERAFARDVRLMDLFRHPTIAGLAPIFSERPDGDGQPRVRGRAATPPANAEAPAFFFGRGGELFGMYHPPRASATPPSAVLICQPMGHEYISYHRACRDLAESLAGCGLPVLRFDYYGTGDSAGASDDGTVERWVADVGDALAEVRRRSACLRVSVIGLRLGGALAVLATPREDPYEHLVLWDPVVRGDRFVSELETGMQRALRQAHLRLTSSLPVHRPPEALGFPMPDRLWTELGRLNLLTGRVAPARKILIVDSIGDPGGLDFAHQLQALGCHVELRRYPDGDRWSWRENVSTTEYPQEIIRALLSWFVPSAPEPGR